MAASLSFKYDRATDILYIDKVAPYAEQNSQELGNDVIARANPHSGDIENLEVLFFSTRLLREDWFTLPIQASFQAVAARTAHA